MRTLLTLAPSRLVQKAQAERYRRTHGLKAENAQLSAALAAHKESLRASSPRDTHVA